MYSESNALTSKSKVVVDMSKSNGKGTVWLGINQFSGCGKDFVKLGYVKAVKNISEEVNVPANEYMQFIFIKEVTSSGLSIGGISLGGEGKLNRFEVTIKPKPGHTYTFQYDDHVKGLYDFKVMDNDGKKTIAIEDQYQEIQKNCQRSSS